MKKIVLFGWLLFSFGAFAQTPYFYYFEGKRQYFELDTKRAFISAPDKHEAAKALAPLRATHDPLRIDVPEVYRSKTNRIRYYTVLNFEERFSEEAYFAKLSEIKDSSCT